MAPAPTGSCHLYRFYVRHPVTGARVLGYIGETARHPATRLMEHVYGQPWADTMCGWEVDDRSYPHKAAVLEAERAAILVELPLYNIEHNRNNPRRIPPWTAQEQAAARRAGRPPAASTRARGSQVRPRPAPVSARPVWMPSRRTLRRIGRSQVTWGVGAWLLVTVAFWIGPLTLPGGALASGILFVGAGLASNKKRRRRRRR